MHDESTTPAPPRPAPPGIPQRPAPRGMPQRPPLPSGAIGRRRRVAPGALLGGYVAVLVAIALWPTPVDAEVASLIDALSRRLPVITRQRVEFAANVLLFVPFGLLLPSVLRGARDLVLPVALVATVTIECVQAAFLDARVPSVLDVIANLTGAAVGILVVAAVRRRR